MMVATPDEVRAAIRAGLDLLRPYQRRGMGIDPDQARAWLAEDLVRRIVGIAADASGRAAAEGGEAEK